MKKITIYILLFLFIFFLNLENILAETNSIYYYTDNDKLYITSSNDGKNDYKELMNNKFEVDNEIITKVIFLDNEEKITPNSLKGWFKDFYSLEDIEGMNNIDYSEIVDFSGLFANCRQLNFDFIGDIDFSNGEYFDGIFRNCEKIYFYDFNENTYNNAISMCTMFEGCNNLEKVIFSNSNFPNLENLSGMFWNCNSLEFVDFNSSFFPKMRILNFLFSGCKSLKEVDFNDSFFGNIEEMEAIFYNCNSLETIDLSTFDLGNLYRLCAGAIVDNCLNWEYESGFANHCYNLKKIVFPDNNTIKICNMAKMFYDCPSLMEIDMSMFDFRNVTDCYGMFYNCKSLKKIYVNTDHNMNDLINSKCEFMCGLIDYDESMFENCISLIGGSGTVYDSSFTDGLYAHIDGGPDNPGYFTDIADYKPLNQIIDEETSIVDEDHNGGKSSIIEYFVVVGLIVLVTYLINRKKK